MNLNIFKPENIDVNRISYSTPYPKKGGRIVYINYINDDSEKVNLVIKTSIMNNPFGINVLSNWASVNLQITPNHRSLKNLISSLDNKIKSDSDLFSSKWKTNEKEYKNSIYVSQNDTNENSENNNICNSFLRANIDGIGFRKKIRVRWYNNDLNNFFFFKLKSISYGKTTFGSISAALISYPGCLIIKFFLKVSLGIEDKTTELLNILPIFFIASS